MRSWLVTLPYDSARTGDASHAGLVTLGWADIQNHASLARDSVYDSKRRGEPLGPGEVLRPNLRSRARRSGYPGGEAARDHDHVE
jgi:hypothetical protein